VKGWGRKTSTAALGLLALVAILLTFGAAAGGQDLEAGLADAEQEASRFEAEASALRAQVSSGEARYRAAVRRAAPSLEALRRSQAQARALRHELTVQEQQATAAIARQHEQHQQEVDEHDEDVRDGVGFGLAALAAGVIALAWGWFRATALVAALTELDLSRAIGICVGGGLLTLIVGAALGSSSGALGAFGSFIFCLGLILPTALLLARHSAEVQRGRSTPLLRRERLPGWIPMAVAGLMLVLFMAGTGSAIFAGDASSQPVSAEVEEEAEGVSGVRGAEELEAARERVSAAKQQAAAPLARRVAARRQLASARHDLETVARQLANARSRANEFSDRLVALEAKEQRQAEKEEARALREQEAAEEAEAEYEEESTSGCDYSPCLPPASDYDCEGGSGDGPAYTGIVEVIGTDIYGLDADGDGIGCE
jgi:hypothetical protein